MAIATGASEQLDVTNRQIIHIDSPNGLCQVVTLKEKFPMHIGQVIRSLREEKGWSQETLAHEAGMGTSHVSRIERGERRLATSRLDALAAALGTSSTAIYAALEGTLPPQTPPEKDRETTVDYSSEALELRKTFRRLSLPNRRLVVDFAQMLVKRSPP